MSTVSSSLIDAYLDWLRAESSQEEIGDGWTSLSVPFLDRHNDFLRVYIEGGVEGFRITDDGQILGDLASVGVDLKAPTRRRAMAENILHGLGLDASLLDTGVISAEANAGDFAAKLQAVLQSMLALDGMANVSPANVPTVFGEDVVDWFSRSGIPLEKGPRVRGKSSAMHDFEYARPRTDARPLRLIQAMNAPDRLHTQSFTFSVIDSRESSDPSAADLVDAEYYAILNDKTRLQERSYLSLLANRITPIPWSRREQFAKKLA